MQTHARGRIVEQLHHAQGLELGRGIVAAARPFEDVAPRLDLALDVARLPGDSGDALPAVVERLQLVVRDTPVLKLHLAVIGLLAAVARDRFRADLEVPGREAPGHARPVEARPADAAAHLEDAEIAQGRGDLPGMVAERHGIVARGREQFLALAPAQFVGIDGGRRVG